MWSIYKIMGTGLWVVVATLVALNIGVFFFMPPRQVTFVLALTVGIVLLISLHWPSQPQPKAVTINKLPSGATKLLVATITKQPPAVPQAPRDDSEKLSPTEARQWLDDFLVKQQKP